MKKILIPAVLVLIAGIAVAVVMTRTPSTSQNPLASNANASVSNTTPTNDNTNSPSGNENVNDGRITTTEETTIEGSVFLKGYKTPSESYGILASGDREIGLEDYDSMKEQFRPYIGDRVRLTFSKICRSNNEGCCRTTFFYCGYVKSWEPLP